MRMPVMPWWAMLLSVLLLPLLQPLTEYGSSRLQTSLGLKEPPAPVTTQTQPQPYIVYHNGQWWKFENNQWYVWTQEQK